MIRYATDAQFARAHLLRSYNDLIVFIEDETCQNMHIRILSAILHGQGRIEHVFPLNGRARVIDAALADPGDNPRHVYLIDSDLDLLVGRAVPACSRLHRLSVYNIEDLLLEETALVEIAVECEVDAERDSLRTRLEYRDNRRAIVRCLLPLFEHYAVVASLNLPIATVSHAVVRLCARQGAIEKLSSRLVSARVREVRRAIVAAAGWATYRKELQAVRERASQLADPSATISGKDYLLPLAHAYLRSALKLRDSFNGLRVRLARHFDPNRSPAFRDFILAAHKASFQLEADREP